MKNLKTKLDLTGMNRREIKELAEFEGHSKSTYYASLKRKWMFVSVA